MWQRKIYYLLSPKLRRVARRLYFGPIDIWEDITGKRDKLTPPKGKIFIGPGDFKKMGQTMLKNFIDSGLKPEHKVLDIGCGIGRIAVPLTSYLNTQGGYNGFDIVKDGISWCQKNISSQFSNFQFKHIDLMNDLYNLETNSLASEFVFPYNDNQFDFIILTSVFTHMQPNDVAQYLAEISRVLKPNGICFATFFIINKHSEKHLNETDTPFFTYKYNTYYLHDDKVKDANIAYKQDFIDLELEKSNLYIKTFHQGWWAGLKKEDCINFQDVLIISKN
jgi:ubiquinone/menaquinone biosynthesis C-methylase UbiE